MISDGLEVEKQRENETTKGVHAGFKAGTLKSEQELRSFPRTPTRLISHLDFDFDATQERASNSCDTKFLVPLLCVVMCIHKSSLLWSPAHRAFPFAHAFVH